MIMSEVKERPILFSTPMVQAILEGRKTQTRRIVKGDHNKIFWNQIVLNGYGGFTNDHGRPVKCPYGEVGDILWVREKTRRYYETDENGNIDYDRLVVEYATDKTEEIYLMDGDGSIAMTKDGEERFVPWKPSIHMPRSACRIRLQITDIRVERLQDISEEDAIAEGIEGKNVQTAGGDDYQDYYRNYLNINHDGWPWITGDPKKSFETIWQSINGEESWNENPWVWALTFKIIEPCQRK